MKLLDLFESAGKIELSAYGAWFNTNTNQYIPVGFMKHYETIVEQPETFGIDRADLPADLDDDDKWAIDPLLYGNGWVRVEHDTPYEAVMVQGIESDLKKIWKFFRSHFSQTERVIVDVVDTNGNLVKDYSWDIGGDLVDRIVAGRNKTEMSKWFTS